MTQSYQHALPTGITLESYEIKGVLGVGGFGITYRAYDHTLDCEVAIKEYLPSMFAVRTSDGTTVTPKSEGDEQSYEYGLKRFLDEARILAKFREPNIVRVLRFLEANHTAYLVMDYENGEPLSYKLKREITLAEEEIRDIIVPILQSLRSMHAKQYLHRDIKPANINIRKDGTPVLLDFGSARQSLENQVRAITRMVTPGYAPFEQYFSDSKQGPWTDIYAIGATMYHCAVGIAPTNATERIAAIQDGEPDPVARANELLHGKFTQPFLATMAWMLGPTVKDRPQSVDEALEAMLKIGSTPGASRESAPATKDKDAATTFDMANVPPELLKSFELTLEHHIGPMSKILIKKAVAKASNVEELTQLVAGQLPSEEDRNNFLSQTRRIHAIDPGRSTDIKSDKAARSHPGATIPKRGETRGASGSLAIDAEELQSAAERLAPYVGPLASVLVKKAVAKASDRSEFYRLLAAELSKTEEREAFLRAIKQHN